MSDAEDKQADRSSIVQESSPGSISEIQEDLGKFPFDAFEFDDPQKDTTPTLTLKSPWTMDLGDSFLDEDDLSSDSASAIASQQSIKAYIDNLITAGIALPSTDSGYKNQSDWTNVHLGSVELVYDNSSGSFTVGETITEETSNNTGVVMSDSGTILVLSDVTGMGIFTDDREITGGTSGETADVDGDTKNVDTDFYHGLDAPLSDLGIEITISPNTTGANNGSFKIFCSYSAGKFFTILGIDDNNIKIQTAVDGAGLWTDDNGTAAGLETDDYSLKIVAYKLR